MSKRYGLWINGQYTETNDWDTITNPSDDSVFAQAALAGEPEVNQALQSAEEGFKALKTLCRGERRDILFALANQVTKHRKELAERITDESGKAIDASYLEVDRLKTTFQLSAEEAMRDIGEVMALDFAPKNKNHHGYYERFPVGVIAAITPFNFPLNLTAHKLGPALAVGNSMVLKPAAQCPTVVLRLAELTKEAGFPDGAFNVLHSQPDVAEKMVTDDRVNLISFTGSAKVGWHLKGICGKKKIHLELGGNAAAMVHEDADIQHAAKRLALGAFFQSGQVCIKAQRLYIHERVWDDFIKQFIHETQQLKAGHPRTEGVVIGPMISKDAVKRVGEWVEDAMNRGARPLLAGRLEDNILTPCVLTNVPEDAKVNCEEIFGPVAIVEKYHDFDEGLNKINNTRYGLQASVFTHDVRLIDKAFRNLHVGGVIINDFPNFRTDNFPYGGIKDSGFGREGVRFAIQEMTELKMLVTRL